MKIPTIVAIVIKILIITSSLAFALPPTLAAFAQSPDQENVPPPDFFVEVEVNNTAPYLGQQIIYTINRYQVRDFPKLPHYEDNPFAGFWSTALIQRPSYTTTIANQEYRVHPTHMALFPTRPGPLVIEPMRLVIPGEGARADIIVESEPLNLQVYPLPVNSPSGFKGAVGQFEIDARLNAAEGIANQPLTLIVEIKGAGNIETLVEPTLPDLPYWRVLKGEVTTNAPLAKELVQGSRQFTWSLAPRRAGEQQIPAIEFSYFDPLLDAYRTISTAPIPVTILADPDAPPAPASVPPLRQEIKLLAIDIRHIKPVPARVASPLSFETYALSYTICLILPLLALGGVWGWQQRQRRWRADTPQARRRRAAHKARQILKQGKSTGADPFVTVQQALLGYLSDKLDQPASGLTKDRLLAQLNNLNLEPALVDCVRDMLVQVEMGRFAPVAHRQEPGQALFDRARRLIEALEQALPS